MAILATLMRADLSGADPFAVKLLAVRWLRAFALPPPLALTLRIGQSLQIACTAHCEVRINSALVQCCSSSVSPADAACLRCSACQLQGHTGNTAK